MANNQTVPMLGELGGFPPRNRSEERPVNASNFGQAIGNGTNGWRQETNIWAPHSATGTRESSRTREMSQFLTTPRESIDGRKGSGSLVASSEVEPTTRSTRPWGSAEAASLHMRSGISPARRASSQVNQGQTMLDNMQAFSQFPTKPRSSLSAAIGSRSANGSYSAASGPTGQRLSEPVNGYAPFGRSPDEASRQADWPDAGSVNSPTDDRRAMNSSEYFGSTSSAAASRNGSLPGSRQSNDPAPFSSDAFSQFAQPLPASRSHHASYSSQSSGRMYSERQPSQSSDLGAMLEDLRIENGSDQPSLLSKPLLGQNNLFPTQAPEYSIPRLSRHEPSRSYHAGQTNGGSSTPDGWPNGQVDAAFGTLRAAKQLRDRGGLTPNGGDFRQPSYVSTGETPPSYDSLYNRNEQIRPQMAHSQLLDIKLRGLQQEQQQRYPQPPFPSMLASPLRGQFGPYSSPYSFANGLAVPQMAPNLPLNPIPGYFQPGVMPGIDSSRNSSNEVTSIQSQVLSEFKMNNKNRRWEFKDIKTHFVEFAGDQNGSRFIQQKLETTNSDEKQMAFDEILPNVLQLMQDVFGNYVIQKFFEHGDQTQKKILANRMKGQVVALSMQMYGCRVVQKALEHVLVDQQISLAQELEKDVMRLVKDQNGNHVIQKAIERVPHSEISFIFDAFRGQICTLANHTYGCRVIQRILEKSDKPSELYSSVVQELHQSGSTLITDQFGNYVTQALLDHGLPEDRVKIIVIVRDNIMSFSRHKYASNVVERCLVQGTEEQKRQLMMKILEPSDSRESNLLQMIKDQYANYVLQKFMDLMKGQEHAMLIEAIGPELIKAKRAGCIGKQIAAIEKKMPHPARNGHYIHSESAGSEAASAGASVTASPPSATARNASEQPVIQLSS